MLEETPSLTDENFWLAFPGTYRDSGGAAISIEIIKRAIDRLADTETSEKLKCQAAIVLGSLLEEKTPSGDPPKLSEQDRARLTRSLSTDIAKLIAQPTQVDSDVQLPQQFAEFVGAKLVFPSSFRSTRNSGEVAIASPNVVRMHLIDTSGSNRRELHNKVQFSQT
jgi:hypothetical protein